MYAGFWIRAGAYFIDYIILFVGSWVLLLCTAGIETALNGMGIEMIFLPLGIFIYFGFPWLYYAILQSSSMKATVGKKAVGIEVVDLGGNRISFAKASGRYFGSILSTLVLCIGYILAGFTEKKQAMHDMIANTLVVKEGASDKEDVMEDNQGLGKIGGE